MSLHKPQYPVLIFWEESWNYTREGIKDEDGETIIPEKV